MEKKILKAILVIALIITIALADIIFLSYNVVMAMSTTNVENVEFDVSFEDEANIQKGSNIVIKLAVREVGVLRDARVSIKDANFKVKEIEDTYVKKVNTDANEIELNQLIAGNEIEIKVPIEFANTEEMTKEYLSQKAKIQLIGTYKNGEKDNKTIQAERDVQINWKEEEQVSLEQGIEKFVNLKEEQTLLEQNINVKVINNVLVQEKSLVIAVPEIQNTLPDTVNVLVNGNKALESIYSYDKNNKSITLSNANTNQQENDIYKIIYYYPGELKTEPITLDTKLSVKLATEEIIEKRDTKQAEIQNTDSIISANSTATGDVYKGYLYANLEKNTSYQEELEIEVTHVTDMGQIQIDGMQDYFVEENGNKLGVNGSTYIRNIKFNRDNVKSVLGEEYDIMVQGEQEELIGEVSSESQWNEKGEFTVSLEGRDISKIYILCTQPKEVGTLKLSIEKYVKGTTGYQRQQLKNFTKIQNEKTISIKEKEIQTISEIELKDTKTYAKLQINKKSFSTINDNTNIQITAILKSDKNEYDLYKNPYIEIKFPEELEKIDVKSINTLYGDEFKIVKSIYVPETKTIQLQLEGEQKDFRTKVEEGVQVVINADLTFTKNTADKQTQITMLYKNENGNETQYEAKAKINVKSKYGAILYNNLSGYNEENTVIETIQNEKIEASLKVKQPERLASITQSFINNYEEKVSQVAMVGNLAGKNTQIQNIIVDQEKVKVTYSEKENTKAEDSSWKEDPENAKSYKIEPITDLEPTEKVDITYQVVIPKQLTPGTEISQKTQVDYTYQGQTKTTSSDMLLAAEAVEVAENNGIRTEVKVTSAGKEITDGQEIPEGQPIKYTVKVVNNTGKDIENLKLVAEHTNAIYYVTKDRKADITDDKDNPEILKFTQRDESAKNITLTAESVKKGKTETFTYEFVPKKKDGDQITGKIEITGNGIEKQEVKTITNRIKTAELGAEILNALDEQYRLLGGDLVPFTFNIENLTQIDQKDVIVKVTPSENLILANENGEYYGDEENSDEEEGWEEFGDGDKSTINPDDYSDGSDDDESKVEGADVQVIEIKDNVLTIKIPLIKANNTATFTWFCYSQENFASSDPAEQKVSISCTASINGNTYYSNVLERILARASANIVAKQSATIQKKTENQKAGYVYKGDKIIYTVDISNIDERLQAEGELRQLIITENGKITRAYIKSGDGKVTEQDVSEEQVSSANFSLDPGEKVQYIAEVEVTSQDGPNYDETIDSEVTLAWKYGASMTLNRVSYLMDDSKTSNIGENKWASEANVPDNPNTQGNPNNPSDPDNPNGGNSSGNNGGNSYSGDYAISGTAWLDQNKDGVKNSTEKRLTDIEVSLVDPQTGTTIDSTTTDARGNYEFEDIGNGDYIVLFVYNSTLYGVTHYHKEGVSDSENSDVIQKNVDGVIVASTDNITVSGGNIQNIDAGFIQNQVFDLSLDKTITSVTVQNAQGTKVVNYNNTKLGKVDIHAKQLAGSNVTVQYSIKVTNEGQIPGYAEEIIDYMPNDLAFNESANQGWYKDSGDTLKNSSLSDTLIQPGETKELTLTLTKQMTENNTGTSTNMAEIAEASNELSVDDDDSTPGNRKDGEDDISSAELLVSVGTGLLVYISISILVIILIGAIVAFILFKRKKGGRVHESEFKENMDDINNIFN